MCTFATHYRVELIKHIFLGLFFIVIDKIIVGRIGGGGGCGCYLFVPSNQRSEGESNHII